MKSAMAEILSRLRRDRGLSQRQAASDLGISQALLSHYENDAREPKLEFIIKACDYYGVTADYLLGRAGSPAEQILPAPHGCKGDKRFVSAACAVFDMLDRLPDTELYEAAVNFLVIPVDTVANLLKDPVAPYDPSRDAEMKMAEAAFVNRARRMAINKSE